jgi:hypothetical protein
MALKSSVFLDITPCSPLEINRRFRGKYRPCLQHFKSKPSEKLVQLDACLTLVSSLAFTSTLKMEMTKTVPLGFSKELDESTQ